MVELMAPHMLCPDHFERNAKMQDTYSNDTNRLIFYYGSRDCIDFMTKYEDLMRVHGLSITNNIDATLFMARPSYFKDGSVTTFDTLKSAYPAIGMTLSDSVSSRSDRYIKRVRRREDLNATTTTNTANVSL